MAATDRRRTTVTLYPGNFEAELTDLMNRAMEAQRIEATAPKRMGTVSEAMKLAKQYDDKLTKASAAGTVVTLWAISYTEFGPLQDEHPPREGEVNDQQYAANMKTFPGAILRASLVTPGESTSLDDLKIRGDAALKALGDLTQVQYVKLETAAWNVNVGDDELPKGFSLASLLQQQRDPDSSQPSDSE